MPHLLVGDLATLAHSAVAYLPLLVPEGVVSPPGGAGGAAAVGGGGAPSLPLRVLLRRRDLWEDPCSTIHNTFPT